MPYNSLVSRTDTAALVPEEVSSAMLTNLSAESAVLSLGTRIPLSRNQTRFPVLSALPNAYFVSGDTGLKQTTEAAWADKNMYVEEIAAAMEAALEDRRGELADLEDEIGNLEEQARQAAAQVAASSGISVGQAL